MNAIRMTERLVSLSKDFFEFIKISTLIDLVKMLVKPEQCILCDCCICNDCR